MRERQKAYFVHAFKFDDKTGEVFKDFYPRSGVRSRRERTWGWFSTFNDAYENVHNCADHVFEDGYYDHALIEEISEGFPASSSVTIWIRAEFDEDHNVVDLITLENPPADVFRNVCNYSIG